MEGDFIEKECCRMVFGHSPNCRYFVRQPRVEDIQPLKDRLKEAEALLDLGSALKGMSTIQFKKKIKAYREKYER